MVSCSAEVQAAVDVFYAWYGDIRTLRALDHLSVLAIAAKLRESEWAVKHVAIYLRITSPNLDAFDQELSDACSGPGVGNHESEIWNANVCNSAVLQVLLGFLKSKHVAALPWLRIASSFTAGRFSVSRSGWSNAEQESAISLLIELDLFSKCTDSDRFQIDMVARTLVPSLLPPNVHEWTPESSIQKLNSIFPSGQYETWSLCKIYLDWALKMLDHDPPDELVTIELLTKVVRYLTQTSQFSDAANLSQRLVAMSERVTGDLDDLFSEVLLEAATLNLIVGKFEDAETLILPTLCREREDLLSLKCQSCLGNILRRQGRLPESEVVLNDALEMSRRILGSGHPQTFQAMFDLAKIFRSRGKRQESKEMFQGAFDGQKLILGKGHPQLLATKISLCNAFIGDSKLSQANLMIEETMQECISSLGIKHLQTMYASMCHAQCLQSLGQTRKYADLTKRNYLELKELLGALHPDTLIALQNRASAARLLGEYQDAVWLQQLVYGAEKRANGQNHSRTLSALNMLGRALSQAGRLDEAIEIHRKVLQGWKARQIEHLQEMSLEMLDCETDLGTALSDTGRYEEAEEVLLHALYQATEQLGPTNQRSLRISSILGGHWCNRGDRYENAAAFLRENVKLRTESLGAEHAEIYGDLWIIARCQRIAGDFVDAIQLLERALTSFTERLGANHRATTSCQRDLDEAKAEYQRELDRQQ